MNMHTMHIVYQIANLYDIRLMGQLVFIRFHPVYPLSVFTHYEWEETSMLPSDNARNAGFQRIL
ncbi:MAG: hypothetical protein OXU23_00640 [Candidatus Poribacteria bacterium]|nr:hypothetical protein [Candidatus Poribacteria bacterium]MDE0466853.1 hypothetical protein [Candidatus Poribacteria bacterium]